MNFKPGDRVRVYCINLANQAGNFVGTVKSAGDSTVTLGGDGLPDSVVHERQCRLLKKKAPRRRVWVSSENIENQNGLVVYSYDPFDWWGLKGGRYVAFIEVKRKK